MGKPVTQQRMWMHSLLCMYPPFYQEIVNRKIMSDVPASGPTGDCSRVVLDADFTDDKSNNPIYPTLALIQGNPHTVRIRNCPNRARRMVIHSMMEDICSMACIHRNNFKAGSFFDATTFQTNGLPLFYLTFGLKNLLRYFLCILPCPTLWISLVTPIT